MSWRAVSTENARCAFLLGRCPRPSANEDMRELVILLVVLMVSGCGTREDAAPAQPERPESIHQAERATSQSRPTESNDADNAYAKGVVTLKTGRTVEGHILLQCPGYLTVCFKIGSLEPEDSERVAYEDVQSVMLEKALSDVDPLWMKLRDEMTIITAAPRSQQRDAAVGGP